MPVALETAPVEVEIKVPGGGDPGDLGPDDPGRGGGGDGDDDRRRVQRYRLGLTLALISISTLFIAVTLIYYARSRVPFYWQPISPPPALWLSTAILMLSSLMMEWARNALSDHRWFVYRRRLLLTSFLGFAFIAAQLLALAELVRQGYYLRSNPHGSVFYVFTGLHGIHLMAGMIMLNYLLLARRKNWIRHRLVSNLIAVYWHFMGLVWVGLFAVLMLL
jgi:cytochrome c oxidase subunit 3